MFQKTVSWLRHKCQSLKQIRLSDLIILQPFIRGLLHLNQKDGDLISKTARGADTSPYFLNCAFWKLWLYWFIDQKKKKERIKDSLYS